MTASSLLELRTGAAALLLVASAVAQAKPWSYQPLQRPTLPAVADAGWCRSPLDAFVLAAMAERGLSPAPAADAATWLRRATLDLTGLPPTVDELAAFVADRAPGARERVVDRLLRGPRYAERWTQWWLDLARYADSQGYEKDGLRRTMWRYRDWVLEAFLRDKPFDRFTIEQIAGDLLPGASDEQRLATAFHRQTMTNTEGGTDDEEFRCAAVADRVETTMAVWMGTTVGCAQCHDHKYDPISQREYYGLFAFFDQTADRDQPDDAPLLRVPTAAQRAGQKALELELTELRGKLAAAGAAGPAAAEGLADLRARLAEAEAEFERQLGPSVPVLQELPADQRRTTRVHLRGSFLTQGDAVQPATPKCWPPLPDDAPRDRLGLARWLVSADNPLTARVQVNRLWAELFGAGLVATGEDFGTQGDRPTHPELLDWLAAEFRDGGWSIRHLLRTIVLSATYGQDSAATPAQRELDPDNRWLARGPAFRLAAETLRDQALAIGGLLAERFGGPSVMPPQPDGIWLQMYSGERWIDAEGDDRHRRGLYTFWRRTSPHPAMLVLDAQSREACVLQRRRTNTPLQALVGWNDPQFHEAARALGVRAAFAAEAGDGDAARLRWAWRRCLLREPNAAELDRLRQLLCSEREQFAADPAAVAAFAAAGQPGADVEAAAWCVVAGVLLNLDELLTKR